MEGPFWEYRFIFTFGLLVFIFYQFEWQRSKAFLYALMLKAKIDYIRRVFLTGREQEDWVVEKAIKVLPVSVRVFLSKNILRSIVHEMYHTLDALDNDQKQAEYTNSNDT